MKFVARNPGRMHHELVQAIRDARGDPDAQVGGYPKVLMDRFGLIERRLPVFAKPEAKRSRYYVTDNFLRSWLAALANPVSAIAFRPIEELVDEADQRLADVEGASLEKLVGQLYEAGEVARESAISPSPIEFKAFGIKQIRKLTWWL